jgi:hypothetical protein
MDNESMSRLTGFHKAAAGAVPSDEKNGGVGQEIVPHGWAELAI